jgi:D-glycero-alpha-D-manno-heptose-7-phosphate kinase
MILTRTPYRISLSGGGTDLPKFFNKKFCHGSIISFSINKYIYISVNYLAEKKIILKYSQTEVVSDVKKIKHKLIKKVLKYFKIKSGIEIHSIGEFSGHGTGLGSSSAFIVGLINAISSYKKIILSKKQIYEIAVKLELSIYPNIGIQDHLACTFGGMNYWKIQSNKIKRTKIQNIKTKRNINNIFIVDTHIKRSANSIIKNYKFDHNIKTKLQKSAFNTDLLYLNLMKTEKHLIEAINNSWLLKKKLNPKVSTKKIEEIIKLANKSGSVASKLLGAGGGGFVLFYVRNSLKDKFKKKMKKFKPIKVKIDESGTKRLI